MLDTYPEAAKKDERILPKLTGRLTACVTETTWRLRLLEPCIPVLCSSTRQLAPVRAHVQPCLLAGKRVFSTKSKLEIATSRLESIEAYLQQLFQ